MSKWESYLEENKDRFLEELLDFIRIPSISALPEKAKDVQQAAESSSAQEDACCKDPSDADETEDEGDDCCSSGGCHCICCGTAVVGALIRSTPIQVTIAPRSVPVALRRSELSPQDAVGALLQPPQS